MQNTKIGWTTHSWNPWRGCNHVSDGCTFCYADRHIAGRYKGDFKHLQKASKNTFNMPLKLHKKLTGTEPLTDRLVFPCSLSDFFHKQADNWRAEAWAIMKATPNLVYQIVTKRPERILDNLPADWGEEGYPNVWLGVSIENQDVAAERLANLLKIPARIHFVSAEPLLGPLRLDEVKFSARQVFGKEAPEDVHEYFSVLFADSQFPYRIDWVIIGGESGNNKGRYLYCPCELVWIEDIMRQCNAARTRIFVKQLGTYQKKLLNLRDRAGAVAEEWPERFQVQYHPRLI